MAQQAQSVIAALNTGATLADQAKALSLEAKAAAGVTRSDSTTDRDVLQYAFSLASPAANKPVYGSVRTAKGDHAVVALNAVALGAEDKVPAAQRASIATQLTNINGEYEFKSFQSHLEEVAKIKRP